MYVRLYIECHENRMGVDFLQPIALINFLHLTSLRWVFNPYTIWCLKFLTPNLSSPDFKPKQYVVQLLTLNLFSLGFGPIQNVGQLLMPNLSSPGFQPKHYFTGNITYCIDPVIN